ncbi:hypothetical protein MLD38_017844 [Melastoma candidum]|uniref:Uncharacterized protein n=1 Tax=Melastoma candidum TaxID=119954 RepID=A0ACB9QRE6_9MYRT|nr:hypothetical protein MLD38_017844 [Melastoma candidum]
MKTSRLLSFDLVIPCDAEDEDNLLQGINSYRQVQKLPPLVKNDRAMCLSDEIAEQLEDKPCSSTYGPNVLPGTGPQFSDYPKLLSKCDIDANHTKDGVILPVCVPKLVPTLVLTNYTHTPYAKYLNNSIYTGAGVGSEDNWMVLVLTTNTPGGSFASGTNLVKPLVGVLVSSLFMGLIVVS